MKQEEEQQLREWALGLRSTVFGSCRTCAQGEDIVEAIRIVLEMRAAGETNATVPVLLSMLRQNFNYRGGESGLRNHITRCEAELWESSRGKG
jgi:hypothetical protein